MANTPPSRDHDLTVVIQSVETTANLIEEFLLVNRATLNDQTFGQLIQMLTGARVALAHLRDVQHPTPP